MAETGDTPQGKQWHEATVQETLSKCFGFSILFLTLLGGVIISIFVFKDMLVTFIELACLLGGGTLIGISLLFSGHVSKR